MGKISVWDSKEDADSAAGQLHTMALRTKLHSLTRPEREEHLLNVEAEHQPVMPVTA